jgi:hypothetical protein
LESSTSSSFSTIFWATGIEQAIFGEHALVLRDADLVRSSGL